MHYNKDFFFFFIYQMWYIYLHLLPEVFFPCLKWVKRTRKVFVVMLFVHILFINTFCCCFIFSFIYSFVKTRDRPLSTYFCDFFFIKYFFVTLTQETWGGVRGVPSKNIFSWSCCCCCCCCCCVIGSSDITYTYIFLKVYCL